MSTLLRLLLVEDSKRDAALLVRLLRQEHYEVMVERVDTAEGMATALDQQDWDLVIADHSLPSFGARAAQELLRQRNVDLPLIIVSGVISDDAAVDYMKQGAADYLLKDRMSRLGEAVQRTLTEKRLRAEKQQAEQQIRFQARLLEAVEQAVIATDLAGTVTYWNRFAERLYGWPEAEIVGRGILEIFAAGDARAQPAEILDNLRNGTSWSGEYLVQRRDGSTFPAFVTGSPLNNEQGALIGMVGVSIDITERVHAQREAERGRAAAEAAVRLREEFLSIAGHELRTPLTSVLGNVQLAGRWVAAMAARWVASADVSPGRLAQVHTILQRTERQVLRLERLVQDLLDASRIQADQLALHLAPCDLAAIVREVVAEHGQLAPARTMQLEPQVSGAVPIQADADRITQVVTNYLSNALRYSPEDQPITIGVAREECSVGGVARVWVQDSGPGLAAPEHERVWERFYRSKTVSHRSGSSEGMGLGLYICRTIIERHGGRVGVESEDGAGARFWFTLPLAAPNETAHIASHPGNSTTPADGASL